MIASGMLQHPEICTIVSILGSVTALRSNYCPLDVFVIKRISKHEIDIFRYRVANAGEHRTMDLSSVEKAVFIVARSFGVLSFLSTICTFMEATADWRHQGKRNCTIVTRLQVFLQLPLGLHGIVNMVGTSAAPKSQDTWLALGNDTSCTVQGAALQLGLSFGVPLDMCLSLSYLLMVQYGWDEMKLRKIEPYFYCVSLPYAVGMMLFPLLKGMYGHVYETCFLRIPETCDDVAEGELCEPTPDGLGILRLVVFGVNMLHLSFSIYVVVQVYRYARQMESQSLARLVAIKGMLYASAVAMLQFPLAVWVLIYFIAGTTVDVLETCITLLLPLIGFFNLLVFMLNRREMGTCYGKVVRKFIDCLALILCGCQAHVSETEDTI